MKQKSKTFNKPCHFDEHELGFCEMREEKSFAICVVAMYGAKDFSSYLVRNDKFFNYRSKVILLPATSLITPSL